MDKIFANDIGHNIEVYVDNMVVKSPGLDEHIKDLEEIFAQGEILRFYAHPKRNRGQPRQMRRHHPNEEFPKCEGVPSLTARPDNTNRWPRGREISMVVVQEDSSGHRILISDERETCPHLYHFSQTVVPLIPFSYRGRLDGPPHPARATKA
ncbi:hypothetical protein CR513_17516, partial [Mucuna pruriens]